jgi:hypothetical protein
MAKQVRYMVRATEGVADEMVRYERNTVISKQDPECHARWLGDLDLQKAYTTWSYLISGKPCIGRWASFGIRDITVIGRYGNGFRF